MIFVKIINFIKNNKVPTIVASVVLVAAIAVGIAFGVMNHKDKVETKPFGDVSSSEGSSSTISVPPIEDNSSAESTSSEDSTSSASETIETNSTPSKVESVSSAQASSKPTTTTTKPASSQPSNVTSSNPTTSTPSNGGNTGTGSKWVCPDPSAHPQESVSGCLNQYCHDSFVAMYKEQEANKDKAPTRDPEDVGVKCWICGLPYGDGHNGTCNNYFENGSYTCHHYD